MNHYLYMQFLYCIRWQLSTPILAVVPKIMRKFGWIGWEAKDDWIGATAANFIGSLIFIWIDMFIFKK